jgi:hypothetical protein
MKLQNINRTAAAGAVAALLAAGAGVAAIGAGAINLGPAAGGAALIQVRAGSHTVVFQPTRDDLVEAANNPQRAKDICASDAWLSETDTCATVLQHCAKKYVKSTVPVTAAFDVQGYMYSCTQQS